MKKYGLIGFPLGHSFSPDYFANKFEKENIEGNEYKAYPIPHILEVQKLLDSGIEGFNITIPYKEDILDFLTNIDESAEAIGAVNCVKRIRNENGEDGFVGYNTDAYGFTESLKEFVGAAEIKGALVFGTGGAAKAVFYSLERMGISYTIVSRKANYLQYDDITQKTLEEHNIIINTTPLGMYPHVDECPKIPYHLLTDNHFCYDLVYNPPQTKFLKLSADNCAHTKNGHDMLILQAEKSWQIWTEELPIPEKK